MKRGLLILTLGVVGAVAVFFCVYLIRTAAPRAWMHSTRPELEWLKHEFNLSDAEFERIAELHASYLPRCMERCRKIEELNIALSNSLAGATEVTRQITALLEERAQMRATCQTEMLNHFLEVSRAMPADQAKRYLAWAWKNTCLNEGPMDHGEMSRAHPSSAAQRH